VEKLMAIY